MPVSITFPTPDQAFPDTEAGQAQHLRQLAGVVRGIMDGKLNSSFDIPLDADNSETTVVTYNRVRSTSRIILTPIDEVAAAHYHAGTVRVLEADITDGSFTISHLPSTLTREFRVMVFA